MSFEVKGYLAFEMKDNAAFEVKGYVAFELKYPMWFLK